MYIRVIPFAGTFDMYGLIYRVPESLQSQIHVFQFLSLPLKNQEELALLVEILSETPSLDMSKIRDISSIVHQGTFFSPEQFLLLEWISFHYIVPIHSVLQVFFPKNMREKLLKGTYDKVAVSEKNYHLDFSLELSPAQSKALHEIVSSSFPLTLLYGITGSGKTHLYIELTRQHLQKGESVLILVPEIVLTSQVAAVFAEYFGSDILIITSDLSEAERTKYWKTLHTGKARLVIGTRSALYYPHQNLGLIIMDEEHDESYNSDKSPRYHTRKVLETWANISGVPVLLGSGTPSIEMMYRALRGELTLVHLLEKYQEKREKL